MSETSQADTSTSGDQTSSDQATDDNGAGAKIEGQDNDVTPAPVSRKTKKITLKVDGAELIEDLPFEIDESDPAQMDFLKKHLQMSKAASKRMSEAAQMKKGVEKLMQAFNENPLAVLKKIDAKKVRTAAEEFLMEQIKAEMMSPEEKQRQDQLAKLKEYEERDKKQKDDEAKTKDERLKDHYAKDYQKKIVEALTGAKLPKTTTTIKRMAYLLDRNLDLGLDLSPADLVDEVRKSYLDDLKELIGGADAETILGLFGDELSNKIRKHDLAMLMKKTGAMPEQRPQTFVKKDAKRDYMTMDEWRESMDSVRK